MNIIIKEYDKAWPIALDDSYGKAHFNINFLKDEKAWNNFIKELNQTRKEVLDKLNKV